jgi:hypothetical protein
MGHAMHEQSEILECLLLGVVPGDERHVRQRQLQQAVNGPGGAQAGSVMVAGNDNSGNVRVLQPPHLAHKVGERRPGRPRVVEDVAGM